MFNASLRIPIIVRVFGVALLGALAAGCARKAWKAPGAALGESCRVWRDSQGIAHAQTATTRAAYACLGFLHGRDRAFQLDYLRRAARGRLAEIQGMGLVRSDLFIRLLGLPELAAKVYGQTDTGEREAIVAYAAGINRGFETALAAGDVYEFARYGYEPEPWTPEDSVAILLLQSFRETQASIWNDRDEETAVEKLGPAARDLLAREGLPWDSTILKRGEYPTATRRSEARDATGQPAPDLSAWLPALPPSLETQGSNSWVISSRRKGADATWLANDPHLGLVHPSFWYWVQVEAVDGLRVLGASLPGYPVVPSGTNGRVAWGLTDSYLDAGDLVAVPKAETKDYVSVRPTVWVKVGPVRLPYFFTRFRRSAEGLPELPVDGPKGHSLVLRWSGFAVSGKGISSIHRIARAETSSEMDSLVATLELPSWNYVFGDTKGNIGYRAQGLVPRRETRPWGIERIAGGPARMGPFLTPDEMPHVFNPSRGYVVTANNQQWGSGGRYDLGRAHPPGFRALRIEELIEGLPSIDAEGLRKIQADVQAVDARFLLPPLLAALERRRAAGAAWNERPAAGAELLGRWKFEADVACVACAIYERWRDRLKADANLGVAPVYHAAKAGTHDDAIHAAFMATLKDLQGKWATTFPLWGEIHHAYFPHLAGAADFPSPGRLSTGGTEHSVNPGEADWDGKEYRHKEGASQRLLVRLGQDFGVWFAWPGTSRDTKAPPITASSSPWIFWRDARLSSAAWKADWSSVESDSVDL